MAHKLVHLTLEQHQQVLYEILYMVDDFCKEHDIKYFLAGGSLLGAVRHKGIIPWDDDIDIAMIREEYERFITLFRRHAPLGYGVKDFRHECNYRYPFAKVVKYGTYCTYQACCKSNNVKEIAIDIFPYDGCPGTKREAYSYFATMRNIINTTTIWRYDIAFKSPFGLKTNLRILYFRLKYLTKKSYIRLFDTLRNAKCSEHEYSACIVNGKYGEGEVQKSSGFIELVFLKFGERDLPAPSVYHDYLTGIYGDFMKLPDNTCRYPSHLIASYIIENDSNRI